MDFHKYFNTKLEVKPEDCNENEYKLMKWIEFHYDRQKTVIMGNEVAVSREIKCLDTEMIDIISFMAIIIAYCPYTLKSFQDIYHSPNHISQKLHNSFVIIKVLESLSLSYKFKDFVDFRSEIEQIMVLTYLYGILPSFYPSEILEIKANIGETGCYKISLKNTSTFAIGYNLAFFGNDRGEFDIDQKTVVMAPKQSKDIMITYSAKDVVKSKVILVISGEKYGQKYSKSKVYSLIGVPDTTYFTEEYTLTVPLYVPTYYNLNIKSPCAKDYVAYTYRYYKNNYDKLESFTDFVSIHTIHKMRLPREVIIEEDCIFDEKGEGVINIKICLVAFSEQTFFLYFINNDAGLFCVKININCKLHEKITENINVHLATNFSPMLKCKCKSHNAVFNIMCPLVFYVEVPCRNRNLLAGLRDIFKNFADEEECRFWEQHLGKLELIF